MGLKISINDKFLLVRPETANDQKMQKKKEGHLPLFFRNRDEVMRSL